MLAARLYEALETLVIETLSPALPVTAKRAAACAARLFLCAFTAPKQIRRVLPEEDARR